MSSKHLVDPELSGLLEVFPTVAISAELLPAIRSAPLPLPRDPAAEKLVDLTVRTISGPPHAPEVVVWVYIPRKRTAKMPCILHIHGGGFVAGSAEQFEPVLRPLAASASSIIVSVDYRLAPETRAPGSVEDCYAALTWLYAESQTLGIAKDKIGVMGESAGGGLAAALSLLARDRGAFPLAFQHLIYPMLDDRTVVAPPHPFTGEFIWTPGNNAFGWSSLLGVTPGSSGVSIYAAPARATDLMGLPPTFISTGSLDLFLEEDLEYARRLLRAGVPVELHVYPGAFHAFDLADASISRAARRDSLDALMRALK